MVAILAPPRLSVLAKARVVVEIVRLYVRVRWLVRRRDLPTALARLRQRHQPGPEPTLDLAEGERLARAVCRTLAMVPTDASCLVRSLVLLALLSRHGVNSTLVIGVRPGVGFGAHAWIELDGQPLLPSKETEFSRLVAL